jgi:hypothetical protein
LIPSELITPHSPYKKSKSLISEGVWVWVGYPLRP